MDDRREGWLGPMRNGARARSVGSTNGISAAARTGRWRELGVSAISFRFRKEIAFSLATLIISAIPSIVPTSSSLWRGNDELGFIACGTGWRVGQRIKGRW